MQSRFANLSLAAFVLLLSISVAAQPGGFDATFGTNGVFTMDSGELYYVRDQAVQSDGKILTLHHRTVNSIFVNRLVRLTPDGALDTTFGGDGIVEFSWANSSSPNLRTAYALAVQNIAGEDRIVVAGVGSAGTVKKPISTMHLMRFLPDGTLDASFGSDGSYELTTVGASLRVVVRPSDKALLNYTDLPGNKIVCVAANGGGVCPGFGSGGMFTANGAGVGHRGLSLDSSERIHVLTRISTGRGNTARSGPAVTRYFPSGTIDTTFGTNGTTMFDYNSTASANDLDVDPFGNIVAVGTAVVGTSKDFAVYRLTPGGAIDLSFNGTGRTSFHIADDLHQDLAIQSNGQIVVVGQASYSDQTAETDFVLIRFNYDGSVDNTFGSGGAVIWNIGNTDVFNKVLIQTIDGVEKIVASGYCYPQNVTARFNVE